ncbi:hypothetical protein ABVK25_008052 [Lepraria finkii]|uniref:Uncharacterized protein n=1 Tax=Lepraria finkii TaxID=1340010 RepID=A0ABR4B766_9LECA
MFLWVYLMLKEFKSCLWLSHVQETLRKLPKRLDGIYRSTLQRLRDSLSSHTFDHCFKALTWVVTAIVRLLRPLIEIRDQQAISAHSRWANLNMHCLYIAILKATPYSQMTNIFHILTKKLNWSVVP